MPESDAPTRRTFLTSATVFGVSPFLLRSIIEVQSAAVTEGLALGPNDGEHLIHFRDGGNIFIKVGSTSNSQNLAMGTQQVMRGSGIPVHRHFKMDEAFLILEGSGFFMLNDVRHAFEKGSALFIPKLSWHGFENPESELLLLWIVTPAGLDGFFRDTCSPPGTPPKQLTRDQIRVLAKDKYFTEFR